MAIDAQSKTVAADVRRLKSSMHSGATEREGQERGSASRSSIRERMATD
jgi:hypothetical protein